MSDQSETEYNAQQRYANESAKHDQLVKAVNKIFTDNIIYGGFVGKAKSELVRLIEDIGEVKD